MKDLHQAQQLIEGQSRRCYRSVVKIHEQHEPQERTCRCKIWTANEVHQQRVIVLNTFLFVDTAGLLCPTSGGVPFLHTYVATLLVDTNLSMFHSCCKNLCKLSLV